MQGYTIFSCHILHIKWYPKSTLSDTISTNIIQDLTVFLNSPTIFIIKIPNVLLISPTYNMCKWSYTTLKILCNDMSLESYQ